MATKKKTKEGAFQPSGEVQRITPLGGGAYAYVFDAKGKTHHVKRDSDKFRELVASLDEELNGRGKKELERLGWA